VDDVSQKFSDAIAELEAVADAVPNDEAKATLDVDTLQVFWRNWPHISSWAGALWRQLDEEMAAPARPPSEPDLDEVGGEGGG